MSMKLSIIIPVYKVEKYIERFLMSVMEQTYDHSAMECILVDDCTPDYSMNMAKDILKNKPAIGYLTISNALQWRLQYGRIVTLNETVDGISPIVKYEANIENE